MFKRGGYILGRGLDSVSVPYRGLKGGRFWERGVDSGSVAHSCGKGGYSLRGRGKLWERRIIIDVQKGIYSGREG